MSDLRRAFRSLAGSPGFSGLVVLILALGIGANTALFSLVDVLLLRPLPYPDPDRLAYLWQRGIERPESFTIVSKPNFLDWRTASRSFAALAAYEPMSFNLSGAAEAEQVLGLRATAGLFAVLGVEPKLGRAFTAAEEEPGRDRVVVLTDGLWRRRFGADPAVVGRAITVDGEPRTVVGVMPPGFRYPERRHEVFVPIAWNRQDEERGAQSFLVAGRLAAGVSLEEARIEMDALGRRLEREHPANRGWTVAIEPFAEHGLGGIRRPLAALSGAVALVLAIACANVANLLLARGAARQKEFALAASLGASPYRLARQALAESLVLAGAGGAAGLLLSPWLSTLLLRAAPPGLADFPFRSLEQAAVPNGRVLAFGLALSLATGLLFGLLPAWKTARADLAEVLRRASGRTTAGSGWLKGALLAAEVSLALVVTTGAGLLLSSVARLLEVDAGLDPRNVATMRVALPQPDFYGPPERPTFCADVEEAMRRVPGVLAVGAISHLPLSGASAGRTLAIEGREAGAGEEPSAAYRLVCPGYFATLGIPLLAGRDFDRRDAARAPAAVIVNQTAARLFWSGEDAVGRRLKLGDADSSNPWLTVVAVVGDVRHFGFDKPPRAEIFRPYTQAAWPSMTLVVKTGPAPLSLAADLRRAASAVDRELPVGEVQTMADWIEASLGDRRFPMQLLGAFALLALFLAALGVFAVMSAFVGARRREIGVRMALGARPADVLALVGAHGLRPVAAGIALGIAGALATTRVLASLLWGIEPGDPLVLGTVALLLALVAGSAAYLPARRAIAVDPVVALGGE